MYNKLILENLDEPFEVTFIGATHNIPTGKFEAEETLGNFVFGVGKKWWKRINKLSIPTEPKIEAISTIEEIKEIEEVKEEVKEEIKEEVKVETKVLAKKK